MIRPATLRIVITLAVALLSVLMARPVLTQAMTTTVLSYGSGSYRYQEVSLGTGSGFESTAFDDSSWSAGTAAFGAAGECSYDSAIKTQWVPSTDLLLRAHFTLQTGVTNVTVSVESDGPAQIFVNGVDVAGGFQYPDDCTVPMTFSVPSSAFEEGDNVLAVRGKGHAWVSSPDGSAWMQFLDAQITTAVAPTGPLSFSAAPATVIPGGKVTATWDNADVTGNDWVSMHPKGAPDQDYWDWHTISGMSGSQDFTAPNSCGSFEFHLFLNGASSGVSNSFDLLPPAPQICVRANMDAPGLDTGLDVTRGDTVSVSAQGQATYGPEADTCTGGGTYYPKTDANGNRTAFGVCNPKSDSSATLPLAPIGALIGRIGSGSWFLVGSSTTFQAGSTGRLYLMYNDDPGTYGNNGGGYIVSVSGAKTADTDGDGLPDQWEKSGVEMNPCVAPAAPCPQFIDLPAMGADPNRPDIFVHIDWMQDSSHSQKISSAAIQAMVQSFDAAPHIAPNGVRGINLHVDEGPDSILNFSTGQTWGSLSRAQAVPWKPIIGVTMANGSYNWTDFDQNYKSPYFLPTGREHIFHYVLAAKQWNQAGNTGLSRNGSDISKGASDIITALGAFRDGTGTVKQQAGVLMHELGHNLGLGHGGGDSVNNKPNYLSIMNYSFIFSSVPRSDGSFVLDYSREKLPSLRETNLSESAGLGSGGNGFLTYYYCPSGQLVSSGTEDATNPIDWNCSGSLEDPTSAGAGGAWADVDGDGACVTAGANKTLQTVPTGDDVVDNYHASTGLGARILAGPNHVCDTQAVAGTDDVQQTPYLMYDSGATLEGFDDWSHIVFWGGAIGASGAAYVAPISTTVDANDVMTPALADLTSSPPTASSVSGSTPPSIPPQVTSATSTYFTVGHSGSFTVTTSGTPTATVSLTGTLPSGVSLKDNGDGTATLSGTAAGGTVGTYPITLKASNGTSPDATQSFTLTVQKGETTTAVNALASQTASYGSSVSFTATVVPASTNTLAPSGAVTFYDNGTSIGTGGLSGQNPDIATFSTSALGVGPHTITASYSGDGNFKGSSDSTGGTVTIQAPTTALYTGSQMVIIGNTMTVGTQVMSAASACTAGGTASFTLDRNPITGVAAEYSLASAPVSGGTATKSGIATTNWQEGAYTVTASYSGPAGCLSSTDLATLTVGSAGDAAAGGGWTSVSGIGRLNFGFTVRAVPNTSPSQYRGEFVMVNNGKWRLKGVLVSYTKTSKNQGAASGTGTLYNWDQALNGGAGGWAQYATAVNYTISFTDNGTNLKTSPDLFGVHIDATATASLPAMPNFSPVGIKGGDLRVG